MRNDTEDQIAMADAEMARQDFVRNIDRSAEWGYTFDGPNDSQWMVVPGGWIVTQTFINQLDGSITAATSVFVAKY